MSSGSKENVIVGPDDVILVTGAGGFIGSAVVDALLKRGFQNVRCLARPSSDCTQLNAALQRHQATGATVMTGNLLSAEDCAKAIEGVSVVIHLVAGRGKSYPACFQNSVVTTRNILDACLGEPAFKRFVNVSSFAVYSNMNLERGDVLDESCDVEPNIEARRDPYVYGKLRQDELVLDYHRKHQIPYVIVRPTLVIGSGKAGIPAHVGIGTFGVFLHGGGSNRIPFTYVENCAEAIILAGIVDGVDGEVFNVVDHDLPSSRDFLKQYKRNVGQFFSLYMPYPIFYLFCLMWEKFSAWSDGQLPPAFNRRYCAFNWKGHSYSNRHLREMTGWEPAVPMRQALSLYFAYQKEVSQ